jgi:hypothetical protein
MKAVGLDIHRVFAEAVAVNGTSAERLGRIGMTRAHLEAFGRTLSHDDHFIIEATGNATAVTEVLGPHVGRVVIANPRQVRLIAEAPIKIDVIDATALARLYISGYLPKVWIPDQATLALRRQVTRRNPDCAATRRAENNPALHSARAFDPAMSARRLARSEGPSVAAGLGTTRR